MRLSLLAILLGSVSLFSFPVLANDAHHSEDKATNQTQASEQIINAHGTVRGIDAENKKITIDHDAIPSLGWPAMTMRFTYTESVAPYTQLKVGDKVSFGFVQQGSLSLLQEMTIR